MPENCPRIEFVPFKHVNAFTDLSTNTIYLSTHIDPPKINDVMMDEYAHIFSRSEHHKDAWVEACNKLYGKVPECNPKSDELYDKLVSEGIIIPLGRNVGNITGIQNLLTDYHLLQAYRKFSQRILGTEGSWEVTGDKKIRLKPTPKGSFPVVVRYIPSVNDFNMPEQKEVCTRAIIAEAKIILGHTRRKMSIPSPDGGTLNLDGDALVTEGREEKKEIVELAVSLGEPMGFVAK
jgi:hypothetical protein